MNLTCYSLRTWRLVLALAVAGFGAGAWLGVSLSLDGHGQDMKPRLISAVTGEVDYSGYRGSSTTGYYLASRFAESQNAFDVSAEHMIALLERAPDDILLLRHALRTLVAAGRTEKAAEVAERVMQSERSDSLALMVSITHAVKQGGYEKAAALLDKAAGTPGMLEIIGPAMDKWLALGRAPYGGETVTLGDNTTHAGFMANFMHYQVALMNDMVGERDVALAHYQKAVDDPLTMPYRLVQALSNHHLRAGNREKAKAVYAQYAEHNPTSQLVPKQVPDINREPMAITPVVETPKQGVAELLFTTASLLFGEDVTRESLIYLRLALYLRDDLPPAQLMLANVLEQMENYEGALAVYRSIKPGTVFYRRGLVRQALNYEALGQKAKAIHLLKKQAETDADDTQALITLGDIYRSNKQFEPAIEAYSRAIDRLDTVQAYHWGLWYLRAICYERSDQWERAEQDFKQALELEPGQPDVLNYLGYSWLVRGEHLSQARDYIEQAYEQRPVDAHIIDSMGWTHYVMGEFDEAVGYLEEAAELSPQDPTINDHLGDAYWRVGRQIEAKFQWRRALQFEPDDEAAVRAKLEQGLPPFEALVKQADGPKTAPVAAAHSLNQSNVKTD